MPYACDTRLDVPNQFVSRYERPTLLLDLLHKHVQGLKIWGARYRQLDNGGCSFQEPMNRKTAFRSYPLGWCKPTDGHHAQKIKLPIIIQCTFKWYTVTRQLGQIIKEGLVNDHLYPIDLRNQGTFLNFMVRIKGFYQFRIHRQF